jgi:hypothetical protein
MQLKEYVFLKLSSPNFLFCSIIIINFGHLFIYLDELATSVKPGGDLVNTVVEISIHAINIKGRGALKQIMPVRLSVSILSKPKPTIFFFLLKCQNKMTGSI